MCVVLLQLGLRRNLEGLSQVVQSLANVIFVIVRHWILKLFVLVFDDACRSGIRLGEDWVL